MAEPKNIVKRLVEQVLGEPVVGDEATPAQINQAMDIFHRAMFPGDRIDNTINIELFGVVKARKIFAELGKDGGNISSAKSIRALTSNNPNDANAPLGSFLAGRMENNKVPESLRQTNSDALLMAEALENLDGINDYVNNILPDYIANNSNINTPAQAAATPPVVKAPINTNTAANSGTASTAAAPVAGTPKPPNQNKPALNEPLAILLSLADGDILADKKVSSPEMYGALRQLATQMNVDNVDALWTKLKGYANNGQNYTLPAMFNKNPDGFAKFVTNAEQSQKIVKDGFTKPFSYRENAVIIQTALNVYGQYLNEAGYNIDRPIDLDTQNTPPPDAGVDGYVGPQINESLQEFTQVANFLVTNTDGGDQIYNSKTGANWLANNFDAKIANLLTSEQINALKAASVIEREDGTVASFTPKDFVRALDAWATPPKANEFGYSDYRVASVGEKYGISNDINPNATVRLYPVSGAQASTIAWLQNNESLRGAIPNRMPLIDEMLRAYTGQGIKGFDDGADVKNDDGGDYISPAGVTDAARLQAVFQKTLGGMKQPVSDAAWDNMAKHIGITAGLIGDLPFGTYGDKEAFVTAINTAVDTAKIHRGNPARAAEAFGNSFLLADTAPAIYSTTPKTYPAGEMPVAADALGFKVTRNITAEDVYAAHEEQNAKLIANGAAAQPVFFNNRIAGVENNKFVVREIPTAAINALSGGTITTLAGLKTALADDPAAYTQFVAAHNLARGYNIEDINMLGDIGRANPTFKGATGAGWAPNSVGMATFKATQAKISVPLKALDDTAKAKIVEELARNEINDTFDEKLKASYRQELKDNPNSKTSKKLRRTFNKFDGATMDDKIDACVKNMRENPKDGSAYVNAVKAHWAQQSTINELNQMMIMMSSAPKYEAAIASRMDAYHATPEYVAAKAKVISDVGVANTPYLDHNNIDLGGIDATLSVEYNINDFVDAYNASKEPVFFKDENGATKVFYVTDKNIAVIEDFDVDAMTNKYKDYKSAYSMNDDGASALKVPMQKRDDAKAAHSAAVLKHQEDFPLGSHNLDTQKQAEFVKSWNNLRALELAYDKQSETVENLRDTGLNKAAAMLNKDFPVLAHLGRQYNDMPIALIRRAGRAQTFNGGGADVPAVQNAAIAAQTKVDAQKAALAQAEQARVADNTQNDGGGRKRTNGADNYVVTDNPDINGEFESIIKRPTRNQTKPRHYVRANKKAARKNLRTAVTERNAEIMKNKLDTKDLRLAKMEVKIDEMRAAAEREGRGLTRSEQLYFQDYKALAKEWVDGMDDLVDYAKRKSIKSEQRAERNKTMYAKLAENGSDISGHITGKTAAQRYENRAGHRIDETTPSNVVTSTTVSTTSTRVSI